MAKVKQWATEIAENAVGCVINDYLKNKINLEDAKTKILKMKMLISLKLMRIMLMMFYISQKKIIIVNEVKSITEV